MSAMAVAALSCADRPAEPPAVSAPVVAGVVSAARGQVPVAEVAVAVRSLLRGEAGLSSGPLTPEEVRGLEALYQPQAYAPLWVDAEGRPDGNVEDALAVIGAAADEGLNPADYDGGRLTAKAEELAETVPVSAEDVAAFDVSLSLGTLRYFGHLHTGRVDPRAVGFRVSAPDDHHDFPMLLRAALADHRMAETAAELTPPLAQYRGLRRQLARYRSLAADTSLEPLAPPGAIVRPGEPFDGLRALYVRLIALGDLSADAAKPMKHGIYEGAIVDAVERFQARHGLTPDGILGPATQAALHVPLTWRVRQIELALERLRWLPDLRAAGRILAVNIPMFQLWGWDSILPDGVPAIGMDVIVGRAIRTRTPVFAEDMRYLIFRPYWDVPPSIARGEILPQIERDPGYLARQNMEIVRGPGDDARAVEPTPENLALLRQGLLRVRQRPGPGNALGLVKFMFPNDHSVYLHGTPATELFSRARRDFSHGCVRVENPIGLAEWALADQPEWTRERIVAAMNGPRPMRVDLMRPIQVILYYITAVVMPEDGTIRFAEDIYGHDGTLDRALGGASTN